MGEIILHFDHWVDVLDAAEIKSPPLSTCGHARSTGDKDFYGTASWGDAVALARYGWEEGRDKLVRSFEAAQAIQRTVAAPSRMLDVAGAYPHAALAAAGAPDCMWSLGDTHIAARPIVRILTGQGVRSGVENDWVIARGAALLSHVDRLEDAGYSVELAAVHASNYNGWRHETHYTVKRAGEALELDRLAFVLAHPSMHRRMVFSIREQGRDPNYRRAYKSYGCTVKPKEIPDDVIFVPHIEPDAPGPWAKPDTAVAHIGKLLADRGVFTSSE